MKLTKDDIKILKEQKRIGFVFAGLFFAISLILNFALICTSQINWTIFILINLVIITLSYFIAFFINRKINKDLKEHAKIVIDGKIEKKEEKTDYETGSGVLYIPILGDLFPKLWGQKMNAFSKYLLYINGVKYNVDKNLFENVNNNDIVEIHCSKYGEILLGLNKKLS